MRWLRLQARHPVGDAFLSGMLAVAVASLHRVHLAFHCAACGPGVGHFCRAGPGPALPFLVASWIPSVGHGCRAPGAWMDNAAPLHGLPMFATVVWLVWVLGHLSGVTPWPCWHCCWRWVG